VSVGSESRERCYFTQRVVSWPGSTGGGEYSCFSLALSFIFEETMEGKPLPVPGLRKIIVSGLADRVDTHLTSMARCSFHIPVCAATRTALSGVIVGAVRAQH